MVGNFPGCVKLNGGQLVGLQVGQLFHCWQLHYQQRQGLHVLREKRAQRSALHCGKEWRKKAQNTRGRKLIVVFKYSRVSYS